MRRWGKGGLGRLGALGLVVVTLALAGCDGTGTASAKDAVSVAYAGALVNLMEHRLGPAFSQATGYGYEGRGAGAVALANQIKSRLIAPDVFISASKAAYKPLEGAASGDIVSWYITFAGDSMVIGYNPRSQYAAQFAAAAKGAEPWYKVLETPGLRLGRTDPKLDPKGVNTLYTLQLAETYYQQPGLKAKLIGPDENPAQIFPEEELVARLTAGQLDAGFFYLNEVKDAGIPYITLPKQIDLSDPSLASAYAAATYTTSTGTLQHGAPVLFSVTIPATVKNEAGAVAFVQYLLGKQGQALLASSGFLAVPITFTGDAAKVPAGLAQYAKG
jgi:molybdate/tungstate transport system substrate-binding protein